MTTQTDTAPLSAEGIAARRASALRLLADGVAMTEGESLGVLNARACADALDALSARVKELEAENKRLKIECASWKSLYERFAGHLRRAYNVAVKAGGAARHGEFDTAEAITDVVGSRDDWKARATQAEAERDALRGDLSRALDKANREADEMTDRWHADQAALAETRAREAGMREALSKPGKLVYLDGRTEDAAHVIPFPMQTADIDTDRDLTESAETIYDEAAKLGYGDGCAVWCVFSHLPGQYCDFGMCEIAPGWEFVGIDPLLTEMFGGRPPEDEASLSPAQPAQERPFVRVEEDGAVVRGIRIEPGMTAEQINAAADAALALPVPAQGADIARELAEEEGNG